LVKSGPRDDGLGGRAQALECRAEADRAIIEAMAAQPGPSLSALSAAKAQSAVCARLGRLAKRDLACGPQCVPGRSWHLTDQGQAIAVAERPLIERGLLALGVCGEAVLDQHADLHPYPDADRRVDPFFVFLAKLLLALAFESAIAFIERVLECLDVLRLHPEVQLPPDAARARMIANGDWVSIETPEGSVRARARLNEDLDPRVMIGEHGCWQACTEIGAPGYDPFGPDGANLNLIIGRAALDPVSGTPSICAYLCEIRRAA
jgi:hypothetical protein